MSPSGPRGREGTRSARAALVGRPNVGKSTLLNALVGEHVSIVSHHPQTTRDRIVGIVDHEDAQLVLVDTPGLHVPTNRLGSRMNQEIQGALAGADVVVFVTDLGKDPSHLDFSPQDLTVIEGLPRNLPVVLVINKIDKLKSKGDLLPLLAKRAEAFPFAAVVPISAKTKDGITSLKKELEQRLTPGPKLYEEDAISDRPARFFVQEYVREQILKKTREEVPHGVAVVVDRWDDSGKIVRIDVTVHVDKPNHKKIVIGGGGAMLKEVGTRARARVETLLGQSVMLKIWVRVTPRWYESPQLLAELGYGSEMS